MRFSCMYSLQYEQFNIYSRMIGSFFWLLNTYTYCYVNYKEWLFLAFVYTGYSEKGDQFSLYLRLKIRVQIGKQRSSLIIWLFHHSNFQTKSLSMPSHS